MYTCNSAAEPVASLPTLQVHRLAGVLFASLLRIVQIFLVEVRLWKSGFAPRTIFFASLANLALQPAVSLSPVPQMVWIERFDWLGLSTSSFAYKVQGKLLAAWTAPLRLLVKSGAHSI